MNPPIASISHSGADRQPERRGTAELASLKIRPIAASRLGEETNSDSYVDLPDEVSEGPAVRAAHAQGGTQSEDWREDLDRCSALAPSRFRPRSQAGEWGRAGQGKRRFTSGTVAELIATCFVSHIGVRYDVQNDK